MNSSAPIRRRLDALTGLRFFAALGVVASHNWPDYLSNPVLAWMREFGYIGVPFFFILSGFVLAYRYLGKAEDRATFYLNRFARIYPIYIVTAVCVYLSQLATHREGVKSGLFVLFGDATLLQSWFGKFAWRGNGVGWSLSAEVFFYAVFPFLSPRIAKFDRKQSWLCLALCVILGIAPPLAYVASGHMTTFGGADNLASFFKFNPFLHLAEFVTGIGLYKIWSTNKTELPAWFPLTLAAGSMGLLILLTSSPLGLKWPLLFTGGLIVPLAGLIYAFSLDRSVVAQFLGSKPLVLLGEASFALYLVHLEIHRAIQTKISAPWLPWATTLLAIGVSIVAHKFFEIPVRSWIVNRYRQRRETLSARIAEGTLASEAV